MPSKRQYDLVQNDDYDTRIPLHPEEAFHHGITFQAKYIGMLDVPRPTTKVEIVAAMRRIRYEFKAKGIKKKKVTIEVSVDGVKVTLRKKRKKKNWLDDGKSVILNHPIYRVFYVSHDSQDLKIFSYIARDGASNVFKCAVFKSSKKSQAMRVVRTVGQAFEVCHKLSLNNPENDHLDQDEQDTLTQDLLSDRLSDITSDKPKRDIMSEGASDRMSLPPDDCSFKDLDTGKVIRSTGQLDILPPPPNNNIMKNHILTSAEMYSSPHSDGLTTGSAESGGSLPPPGTALSVHHELQLMREQLGQQTQQTQAALAQLQLAREQLAAEQAARLEAQARTHQLLIHNRELLDHIASLVGHLQGSEKSGQQTTPPHMTMPQQQSQHSQNETSSSDMYEYADVVNPIGFNMPENRNSASFLPTSPLRTSFNPGGNMFNFSYPHPQSLEAASFESQMLQKLHALNNFPPSNSFNYSYSQSLPFLLQNLYTPSLNNTFQLQNPPQKNLFMNKPFVGGRHSEPRQLNPNYFNHSPPSKKDDYHTPQYSTLRQQNYNSQQGTDTYQKESDSPIYQKIIPKKETDEKQVKIQNNSERMQRETSPNLRKQQIDDSKHLKIQQNESFKREASPRLQDRSSQLQDRSYNNHNSPFIKPHSQMGTLTTTDADGKLRVVVPVLSGSRDDLSDTFSNLRTNDRYRSSLARNSSDRVSKSSDRENTLTRHRSK